MPICIECSYPVSHLYSAYSRADDRSLGKGVRLTQCPRCKRFADKYVEHDFVVIFIDLVLIKPQVYRHLLFNRLESDEHKFDPSIIRLGVLLLLFDVYLTWARIEKSPLIETTFLSRAPIIVQYLFFLTLNALATLAHHLTVRLLASFITSSSPSTPTKQSTATANAAAADSQPPVPSNPTTPILPSFPQQLVQAQQASALSPPKNTPHSSVQELPGLENQRPHQPSPSSPRDAFCDSRPPLRRASTTPMQTLQPLSPPSQASPTAISTALFVSSCAKLFPILLVIWGPDGRVSSSSSTSSSGSDASAVSTSEPNLAQRAEGGMGPAVAGSAGSGLAESSPSVSSSLLESFSKIIPAGIPTSYVASFVDLMSSLFTLGAADMHLVLLSNIEALYILLGCGYMRAMALAVAGLLARWAVQKVILGAVGVDNLRLCGQSL
ncbi:Arv1-like family-domain-containing protein [Aspergillus spinulosporus]